jgi:uncharacterized protein (TIGR02246 family)
MTRWIVPVVICFLAGPAFADPTSDARAHEEAFARLCGAGDVAGVMALYADDAVAVWPGQGQEATGKAAIEKLATTLCKERSAKIALKSLEVFPLDDTHLVTVAHWEDSTDGPPDRHVTVRSTEVLVKSDGKWRYLIDHASIGVPPRVAAAARRRQRAH